MKKLIALLLAMVMVLSLVACGQKNDEVVKDDGAKESDTFIVGNLDSIYASKIFIHTHYKLDNIHTSNFKFVFI